MTQVYKSISDNSKLIQADTDTVNSKTNTLFVKDLQTNKEIVITMSTLKKHWTPIDNITP